MLAPSAGLPDSSYTTRTAGQPYDPAPQATRQGWPYSRQAARAPGGAVVYSRATPGGWPALSTC